MRTFIRSLQRRLVLTFGVAVATIMVPSLTYAQQARASTATALDVFLACRHRRAFVESDLQKFCRLPLPTTRRTAAEAASQWAAVTPPSPDTLIRLRKDVLEQEVRRRAAAAAATGGRSTDLAHGQVVFLTGDTISSAVDTLLQVEVAARIRQMRDSLGISRVEVVAYRLADAHDLKASNRSAHVKGILHGAINTSASRPVELKDTVEPADTLLRNRVAIFARVPIIAANSETALEVVRFTPGGDDLTPGDRTLVGTSADQLSGLTTYRHGALVEVVGYPDAVEPGVKPDSGLAGRRAAALKAALVEDGIDTERIVLRVGKTPLGRGGDAERTRSTPGGRFDVGADRSVQARISSTAPAPASTGLSIGTGWEPFAQAAADALYARARREAQQYALTTFASQLCAVSRSTLEATCMALSAPPQNRYLPSLETIRSLLQQDVERLPERAVGMLLTRGLASDTAWLRARARSLTHDVANLKREYDQERANGARSRVSAVTRQAIELKSARLKEVQMALDGVPAAQEAVRPYASRAVMALYAFDYARRVHRGENPLEAISGFDAWLRRYVVEHPSLAYLESVQAVRSMHYVSLFVSATLEGRDQLRSVSAGEIPRDTLFRYAALQLLANSTAQERVQFTERLPKVVEARQEVESVLPALDSIRRRIVQLQPYGDSTREQRRALYAAALANIVQIGASGFTTAADDSLRERLLDTREILTELILAVRTQQYPKVLHSSLVLMQSLTPSGVDACTGAECSPGTLGDQVRALNLAVDISEAQTQDDLRQAMSRFVDGGGNAAGKRFGTPTLGVHLNAYLGAGFGWREGSGPGILARLPIGAEAVWRTPALRKGMVVSGFVQVVDLGGFLPQQGDSTSRSSDERLAAVLTPGIFAMTSVGGIPFSAGIGVTSDTRAVGSRWRVRPRGVFFIGLDMPLLRIR